MLQFFLCLLILCFFHPRLRLFVSILIVAAYGAFHPEIYYIILFGLICGLIFLFFEKSDSKIINRDEEKINSVGKTIQELSVELNIPENLIRERLKILGITPPRDGLISNAIIKQLGSFEPGRVR